MNRRTFFLAAPLPFRKFINIFDVVHALLLLTYLHGNEDTFLEHLGFTRFLVTSGFNVSPPSELQQSHTVSQSFFTLSTTMAQFLHHAKVLLGSRL
jgi:hypothetical protein